ncbi:hypothetical protein [Nonomuraea cavernae]|uniref:Uncharacterized protein n=1 Tax=Nonomuraea cavernae TaxID=2045107 RepID=A0A918DEX2_9ACTN|nr:hypothetical protein [Nonomuraea cavernae]MCA2184182.1 hypothetical protein [Nonomuraea cavernae]GGO62557.1 hypothetical protein GCM10012289_07500 [Nonomuraea cavernae]
MPKFRDLSTYAATIAPVINAVHINVHASAGTGTGGLLMDLRYRLPLGPLTLDELAAVYRYGSAHDLNVEIRDHLRQGTLTEDGERLLRPTPAALAAIDGIYAAHAAATRRIWAAHDLVTLADLAGRVLDTAERDPGGAFAAVTPPYEPDGTPAGVLLFNRLAALRYHRADAHAAAWHAAGLTAAGIVDLCAGPLRDEIEDDTNRRAAQPYHVLDDLELKVLFEGLLALA